jgi:hypothetical protein
MQPPVARVFDGYQQARDAIRALEASGVDPRSISVVTRSPRDAETLEHDTGASDDLEDAAAERHRLRAFVDWLGKFESATVPGFGAILGTGNLWQDVTIAGRGRGSITGALVGKGVPVDEAEALERSVLSGGILLVVHGQYDAASVARALQGQTT